jgi:hypothetical protein
MGVGVAGITVGVGVAGITVGVGDATGAAGTPGVIVGSTTQSTPASQVPRPAISAKTASTERARPERVNAVDSPWFLARSLRWALISTRMRSGPVARRSRRGRDARAATRAATRGAVAIATRPAIRRTTPTRRRRSHTAMLSGDYSDGSSFSSDGSDAETRPGNSHSKTASPITG